MKYANCPAVTPKPDTENPKCRTCRKVLVDYWTFEWPISERSPLSRSHAGYGYHGNSFFCSLRCGFRYAKDMCLITKGLA